MKDIVYEKVFDALYWIAKEESKYEDYFSPHISRSHGVKELKYFNTRSETVLREMLLTIASVIVKEIVTTIKTSYGFRIITDEVTDTSNISRLVTFIKTF